MFESNVNVALVVEIWEFSVKEFSAPLVVDVLSKEGRLAINLDAAWIKGSSVAALVVRDSCEKVIFFFFARRKFI